MMGIITVDADVRSLSSTKLGYLVRLARIRNMTIDEVLLDKIQEELIYRGHYKSELKRRSPH